jgi:hypothetical protein
LARTSRLAYSLENGQLHPTKILRISTDATKDISVIQRIKAATQLILNEVSKAEEDVDDEAIANTEIIYCLYPAENVHLVTAQQHPETFTVASPILNLQDERIQITDPRIKDLTIESLYSKLSEESISNNVENSVMANIFANSEHPICIAIKGKVGIVGRYTPLLWEIKTGYGLRVIDIV